MSLWKLVSVLLALFWLFFLVEPAFVHPGQIAATAIVLEKDVEFEAGTPDISGNIGVSQIPGHNHLAMTAQETFVEFVVNFDAAYTSTKRPSGVWANRKDHVFFVAKPSADRASIQNYINIYSKKNSQCRATVLWFEFNAKTEIVGGRPYNHGIIGHQEWPLGLFDVLEGVSGDISRSSGSFESFVGEKRSDESNNRGNSRSYRLPECPKFLGNGCIRRIPSKIETVSFTLIGIIFAFFGALLFLWLLNNPDRYRVAAGVSVALFSIFLTCSCYIMALGTFPWWTGWLLPFL